MNVQAVVPVPETYGEDVRGIAVNDPYPQDKGLLED
jgi:hypothetical protein